MTTEIVIKTANSKASKKHPPIRHKSLYLTQYDKTLLFPVPRQLQREKIGVQNDALPFHGCDIWTAFELSWLNLKGKPITTSAEFTFPCTAPNIHESKALKTYLNSFNMTQFDSAKTVKETLVDDLSEIAGEEVIVNLLSTLEYSDPLAGICLDDLDVSCETYTPNAAYLMQPKQPTDTEIVTETLYSNLLKSNCPMTGLPDWASIQIDYKGKKIHHGNLLKYIISYRNHTEFHEQCVERMFMDIMAHCKPQELTLYARYTRRGGLDINPYRTTKTNYTPPLNQRLYRQ